jgi:hypothetical protein
VGGRSEGTYTVQYTTDQQASKGRFTNVTTLLGGWIFLCKGPFRGVSTAFRYHRTYQYVVPFHVCREKKNETDFALHRVFATFSRSIPYDPYLPLVFQGEEILQTMRGFTHGYDFYAPVRNVAFHLYAAGENTEARSNIHTFDENEIFFPGVKKVSYLRLIGISGTTNPPPADYFDKEENRYGLGRIRNKDQFYTTFGIHPESNSVNEGLCDFVQGMRSSMSMDGVFRPFLRYDKMGIDYSRINYQYKTPDWSDTPIDPKELEYLRKRLKRHSEEKDKQDPVLDQDSS